MLGAACRHQRKTQCSRARWPNASLNLRLPENAIARLRDAALRGLAE